MDNSAFSSVMERISEIEKNYGSLENFVMTSTIFESGHRMKIEEEYSSFGLEMNRIYQDLWDLEFADLLDFEKFFGEEHG